MNTANRYYLSTLGILLLLLLFYFINPLNLEIKALKVIVVGLFMISLWILEWIPMPVVALIPLFVFPIWNIESIQDISKHYADPIIFLFMGGFFLALAIEKWNLHQRIALNILKKTGGNGNQILLGFMISTFVISMWISNTATTMMMFPIALSVLKVMSKSYDKSTLGNFSTAILLSIAYASNIGGLSTIIGTPPNTAYVGFMADHMNINISFFQWFLFCFPLAVLILIALYLAFTKWLFPNDIKANAKTDSFISSKLLDLGPWTKAEKRVFIVFICTATLWMTKDLIVNLLSIPINDTIIAIMGAFALFCLPSGMKPNTNSEINVDEEENVNHFNNILNWKDTSKMAWGILLMFGGGLALAKAMENAGVMKMIGEGISNYAPDNRFLLIMLVATVSIFLSEVMSNIAQVIVMAPILASLAIALQIPPIILGIPMTLAASCAGMLPMGTPPNAIAYSSGLIPLKSMLRAGFVLNLFSIVIISLFSYFIMDFIF
ncbi:MAG: anion permease [Saprospiraceae bacterium]|uniref:Anion permease n=1 Tax=Candidatus Defluviibacterium haderslevense TaxID=2981993 RepID=A0A9D7S952_9BACT|nr:anion permease [Candidatus Defluviibacterium haderslevense]